MRVLASVAFEPRVTFPKLNVPGLTVNCPACEAPVPVSDSVTVAVCALLVNDNAALTDPAAVGLNVTVKGRLCPAGTVNGSDRPLTLKAELLVLAAVMVTLAPVALSVPEAVPLLPTTMLPRLREVGVTASCPTGAVPVPVSDSVVVVLCALLVKDNAELTDPVAVGLNVTVKGTLCPAGTVIGSDRPLTLNAELLVLAAVMVTLAPVALRLPDAVPLFPTTTLPTFSVDGVTESCPLGAGAVVPVPLTGILSHELEAVLLTVTYPLVDEFAVGAKVTFIPTFCPEARTSGRLTPEALNAELRTRIPEMVRLVFPELLRTTTWVWDVPAWTAPKLREDGELVSCCVAA